MAYKRKTKDRWDIITDYGYGEECECSESTYADAKATAKAYRENTNASVRIEKHREKIPDKYIYELTCTQNGKTHYFNSEEDAELYKSTLREHHCNVQWDSIKKLARTDVSAAHLQYADTDPVKRAKNHLVMWFEMLYEKNIPLAEKEND